MTAKFENWFDDVIRPAMKANGIRLAESDLVLEISRMAWFASRCELVVELPQKCMCGNNVCKAGNFQISKCEKAMRAAGITVKGGGDE